MHYILGIKIIRQNKTMDVSFQSFGYVCIHFVLKGFVQTSRNNLSRLFHRFPSAYVG